jgi:hypothetical protein
MTSAAASSTPVTTLKSVSSGVVLKNPAAHPATLLPNAFDKNQTPIIMPTMRAGATLVTALMPTGLRHSSPNSAIMYATISHHGLTLTP